MKLRLNILLALFFGAFQVHALPSYILVDSGNAAYAKANYAKAIGFYTKFEESGYESEQVYYNMGNCYYKTGDIAKCILYYEKAKKLNPTDADLLFNLQLASLKTPDKIVSDNPLFFVNWWHNLVNSFTEKGWSVICILLLFISALLFVLYNMSGNLMFRQLGFWGGLVMAIFCVITFAFAKQQYETLTVHDTAIIMSPSVTVKGSPNDKAIQLFIIHEGAKVNIVKTEDTWTEIKLSNGSQGWLLTSDISPI